MAVSGERFGSRRRDQRVWRIRRMAIQVNRRYLRNGDGDSGESPLPGGRIWAIMLQDYCFNGKIDISEGDAAYMREALGLATKAYKAEEVPVGAVVVRNGQIIGRAYNQTELLKDATAHAEMLALTQAEAAVGDWRLTDCDLYVTKEPCVMCAGALVHVRMRRVIFGCDDPRSGGAGGLLNLLQHPALNHHCEITAGVLQKECAAILQSFFKEKREKQGMG